MDLEHRITKLDIEDVSIINIYGFPRGPTHNTEKRNRLFREELPKFLNKENYIIIAGDFNATLEKSHVNYSKVLYHLINGLDYTDGFRHLNPDVEKATFVSQQGASQIYSIFIPSPILQNLINSNVVNYMCSDHNAVLVTIRKEETKTKPYPSPYWKMNVSLLAEKEYEINIEKLLTTPNETGMKPHQWWECYLKPKIKKMTIIYSKLKKKDTNNHDNFIEKVLNALNQRIEQGDTEALKNYLKIKSSHKAEQENLKMKGNGIRGRLQAPIHDEEIGLAHILNEKKKTKSKIIKKLKNPKNNITEVNEKG